MPRKRRCNLCHKAFSSDDSVTCPDCESYNAFRCGKLIPERQNKPGEIHFSFSPSDIDKLITDPGDELMAKCEHNEKNEITVTINLYNHKDYKTIVRSINHEFLHVAIALSSDWKTSKLADTSGLMIKLTEGGCL